MQKIIFNIALLISFSPYLQAQTELYINNATHIVLTDGTLTLNNTKLTNNGTVSATNSTVILSGNGNNSTIGGSGITSFNNLTIDKTSNNAQLNQTIDVSGNLSLTSGSLELVAGSINFGTTGSLQNETAANRVYGTGGELIANATLNAPNSTNLANLGAEITSTENLGNTIIKRGHTSASGTGGSSLLRYYDITPTNNTALNATLKFSYFDTELNGNTEAGLQFWRSTDAGTTWMPNTTVPISNTLANWTEISGISAFSRWTLANIGALPVKLLAFIGRNIGTKNILTWQTATEQNNKGFFVQRSIDGLVWEDLGFVAGANNSLIIQNYTFTDATFTATNNFYRLLQIDFDEQTSYSTVIRLKSTTQTTTIYPNPNPTGVFNIDNNGLNGQNAIITNILGQKLNILIENNQIDLSEQPAGTYFLQISGVDTTFKLIKE
jgi:Secretion system C-terminal sorting domain